MSRVNSNTAYQWTPLSAANIPYTDNGLNQYTSVASANPTYDGRGNLTGDGSNTYTYDIYNRLLTRVGGMSATFGDDPAGRLNATAAAGV